MKEFLEKKVSNPELGHKVLLCEVVDYCYDYESALRPYLNSKISHHQIPHNFKFFRPTCNGIKMDFCCMQYRFLSCYEWQPLIPEPSMKARSINEIMIPYLASVGGVQRFAKEFQSTAVNVVGDGMCEEMQNLLTAQGYPKNIVGFLNMFEADSINMFMHHYASDNPDADQSFSDVTMNLKSSAALSNMRNIDFGMFEKVFKTSSKCGFIKFLCELPRYDEIEGEKLLDIGKYLYGIVPMLYNYY